ncbi:DUF4232 domain-containing protein [Micromonospora sp. NBC_01796]|uniref:DUF4232 domain-containing protein n=1 Tax=Micromonospora sp. NBC_01796 TaxID=2975987 RepID=UPI002DD9B3C8|nr:DUF4232 domain-containing protein [Micromonospora sp. NBC_01796]WSA83144.1 DUF4232 domain-containing protein [Micromonospora sp. NBC_01796]
MRSTRFLVATCLASATIALGACGGGSSDDNSSAPASPSASASTTAGVEPGTSGSAIPGSSGTPAAGNAMPAPGSTAPGGAAPAPGAAVNCTAKGLKAELTVQQAGMAMLILTNAGRSPCRVEGWVNLRLEAADGGLLKVSQQRVSQPGATVAAELDPGESAYAGIKWTTCAKSAGDCSVATTVRVGPAGDTDVVVAHVTGIDGGNQTVTELPLSSVQIGTIQPSRQGVVAW